MSQSQAGQTGEVSRGLPVLIACMVGMMFGISAVPFYTLGIFAVPVMGEFEWTGAQYQGAFTFMLAGALAGPFTGWLCDKLGNRVVALTSITLFSVAFAAIGVLTTQSIWSFYACWAVMAFVAQGTGPIPWTRAIGEWFYARRGLALGIALMGSGVAAFFLPPLTTAIIGATGWRTTYMILGAMIFCIAFPTVWWGLRRAPQWVLDDGASLRGGMSAQYGYSLGDALRSYRFWVIALAFSFISLGVAGIISNLVPLLVDRGFTPQLAAGFAAIIGASVILGRLVVGALLDRFWGPAIAFVLMALPAASCILLASADLPLALTGAAVFVVGFAAGAEFDIIAYFVTRYFGLKNYGKIYGVIYTIFFLGAGLAPMIFARVYDQAQSYNPILLVSAGTFLFSAALLLTLGRYPDHEADAAATPALSPAAE
ncbi:MAG: MFS transporter [Pseudomonadota bacterium]